jgi:chaperonin GroES
MIQLLDDRIIVEPDPKAQKSRGGIFLPENCAGALEPKVGTVTHVGDGRVSEKHCNWTRGESQNFTYDPVKVPLRVKVGDRIVFNAYAITKWEHDGKTYSIITERDVLGVLDADRPPESGGSLA